MRVLIIEDSVRLSDTLTDALKKANFTVDTANDGKSGFENAMSGIYDVIILDIMLPMMSGYEVLSAIRKEGQDVPVLILSAKTELEDKINGFMLGADDYVTKPVEIQELIMRLHAIGRRRGKKEIASLRAGKLILNNQTGEIRNLSTGKTMPIAGKELQLLELFLLNQNQVLEKDQIATKIWGYDSETEYNNVEVYVSFLRRKLNHLSVDTNIRTVRGVGYILEVEND